MRFVTDLCSLVRRSVSNVLSAHPSHATAPGAIWSKSSPGIHARWWCPLDREVGVSGNRFACVCSTGMPQRKRGCQDVPRAPWTPPYPLTWSQLFSGLFPGTMACTKMKVVFFFSSPPTTKNVGTGKSPENRGVLFLRLWMRFSVKYMFLYISLGEESSRGVKVRCAAAATLAYIDNIIFFSWSFPFRELKAHLADVDTKSFDSFFSFLLNRLQYSLSLKKTLMPPSPGVSPSLNSMLHGKKLAPVSQDCCWSKLSLQQLL